MIRPSQKLFVFFLFSAWFLVPIAKASIVELELEKCVREEKSIESLHSCARVERKLIDIEPKRTPAQTILTANSKKDVFRHELPLGSYRIEIGAWKEDPLKAVTVLNVSLFENGRGQVDYNEVSFFDDRDDNYFSLALRPRSNLEFYRIKIKQSSVLPVTTQPEVGIE